MSTGYEPPQDQPEYRQGLYQDSQYAQHTAQPYPAQGQQQFGPGPQPFPPQGQPPYGPPPGQPPYGPPPGQPPYGPPPGGFPRYGGQHPDARRGAGLAISALVVGILALLLCWVPIINNFAAIVAVVGLAMGVPALVSARRGMRAGAGLAAASVIISVLALVGVLATQAFYSSVIDDVNDDLHNSAPVRPSSAQAGEGQAEAPPAAPVVLALGQPGQLTEYTVTVDSVTLNGNDIVAKENQFNSPPTGQYVLVGITVTYNGTDEGDPWIDLSTKFIGTDSRKYNESSCSAVVPNEASDLPTLLPGGTGSFQACLDVAPTAIPGGQVEVAESLSFDDVSAVWAVQ